MKKAIITGITGQDGAYLAGYLLDLGYEVVGTFRRTSSENFWRLRYLGIFGAENLRLVEYDLMDEGAAFRLIASEKPDEVYNLAAQSFVGVSFEQPSLTLQVTGLGVTNLLEAIRTVNPEVKFYQASTSEMFGQVQAVPQKEDTPFYPRSPYGAAKMYAHWMTVNYRESYNIFGCSGILFNHESPLRGKEFVTRKITDAVAQIKLGISDCLYLGNINAKRDWGFAGDFVKGMHAMMQHNVPDTFVLATNRTETVRDFVKMAFFAADIEIEFLGQGLEEVAVDNITGKPVLKIDPNFYRPAEVDLLIGDATKAEKELNWRPEMQLSELVEVMVKADIERYND